jgi:hypothetical protein
VSFLAGYTQILWRDVLQWPEEEYGPFLTELSKAMENRQIHTYRRIRIVYGRKPEGVEVSKASHRPAPPNMFGGRLVRRSRAQQG